MLKFLPGPLKGFIASIILITNTIFWCLWIYAFAVIKFILPLPTVAAWCRRKMVWIGEMWITINSLEADLMHKIHWDIEGIAGLDRDQSYLISANHQSWVDIVVLQHVFNRRIPFLRFFLKRELLYVPFMGLVWWAMDYPFMRRYSKEYLEKHPEMRGRDLETTRKACERFRGLNISILNFLEGTRLTESKYRQSQSPYCHLLPPKTGGIAFVLQSMGSQFDSLLDVTIFYPEGSPSLWKLLSGQVNEIVVRVRRVEIPKELIDGNYLEQDNFRAAMTAWVRDLWKTKDELLGRLHALRDREPRP
jgi:1-acyl-sn-glycerol-3-phosphate acyltransferase